MKTHICKALCLTLAFAALSFGQATMSSTTLSTAMLVTDSTLNLTSATGVLAPSTSNQVMTELFIDKELMRVTAISGTVATVSRGAEGTPVTAHNNASVVWLGPPSQFGYGDPSGQCTSTNEVVLPRVSINTGRVWNCNSSIWQASADPIPYAFTDGYFYVSPSACGWSTTGTPTGTNGMTTTGASVVPTNQVQVSNAGASVNTLNCYVNLPARLTASKGVIITDIVVMYGVQTTTLSSINGAAVSTILFPVAGATETASTVTPVAIAGAITQSSTTANLASTTAGAFFTSKLTLATPLNVVTDRQVVLVTEVFNQAGSAAQIIQTPGLIVHYTSIPL